MSAALAAKARSLGDETAAAAQDFLFSAPEGS
jgi:hypothetical protein